jgi:ADP-heptose:LPS heptosyltransferase
MDRPADSDAAARQRTAALLEDLRAGRVRRVLAARFARLGDVLFTTPALRALAAALPEASIDYLTTRGCRDLISQHPAVSDTLLFERGAHRPGFLARRRELRREIARRRYDLAVVFESNRVNRRKLARLCRAAGVRHLIDRGGVPEPAPGGPRHSCDRHLAMLSPLGIRPDGDPYDLHYSADDARRAEEILGAHGAAPASAGDRPLLVGFQPGFHYAMQAPWLPRTLRHKTYKAWPRERWSDLGQRLCDGLGARVVLTGAGFERGQAARIARAMRPRPGLEPIDAAGATSVGALVALIDRLDAFVSVDTGSMHMASALGVPTLALFGPTDPAHHGPYGRPESSAVLRSELPCSPCKKPVRKACPANRCMTELSAARVFDALQALLVKRPGGPPS